MKINMNFFISCKSLPLFGHKALDVMEQRTKEITPGSTHIFIAYLNMNCSRGTWRILEIFISYTLNFPVMLCCTFCSLYILPYSLMNYDGTEYATGLIHLIDLSPTSPISCTSEEPPHNILIISGQWVTRRIYFSTSLLTHIFPTNTPLWHACLPKRKT